MTVTVAVCASPLDGGVWAGLRLGWAIIGVMQVCRQAGRQAVRGASEQVVLNGYGTGL